MRLLFDGKYAPLTDQIGFLECSPGPAAAALAEWQRTIQAKRGVSVELREMNGGLPEALLSLAPLTSVERRRMAIVPTASAWSAYLDNGWRGSDAFGAVSNLAKKLGCRGARLALVPHSLDTEVGAQKGRYGSIIFELYSPEKTDFLNILRSVSLVFDGGKWVFNANGQIQDYENSARYAEKLQKDRFSAELLDEYLRKIGIRAFDEAFYVPNKEFFLIEKIGPSAPAMRSYSLEEARAGFA